MCLEIETRHLLLSVLVLYKVNEYLIDTQHELQVRVSWTLG